MTSRGTRFRFGAERRWLMLLVLAVLAPLAAFQAAHVSKQRAILESHEHIALDGLARQVGDRLELELVAASRLLKSLSTVPELTPPLSPECHDVLAGIQSGQPYYTNFSVVDKSRRIVCSSGPLAEPVDVRKSENIRLAFETRGLSLSPFKLGLLTGRPVIVLSQPLFGPSKGQHPAMRPVVGTLNTGLSLAWLQTVLEQRPLPEGTRVTVLAPDGLVLASSDRKRPPGMRIAPADLKTVTAALSATGSGDASPQPIDDERFLSVYEVGGLPAGTLVTAERSEALALGDVDRLATWWLAAFAVLIVVSLGFVYLIVDRLILRRLDHLSDAARGYARGVYDGEADIWKDNSGLSALGRDLDGMAGDLHARERSLRTALEDMTRARAETARFAYIAAHDLQEPLRAIGGFTRLLEKRLGPVVAEDETTRGYMRRVVAAAERMRVMFKELMDYAVMDSGERRRESVDLETVADRALRRQPDVEVQVGRLPVVSGDPRQLQRLMDHLIDNALVHGRSPEDGKAVVVVSAQRRGDQWEISVRDQGAGIPTRDREAVFHLFKTLKARDSSDKGSGKAIGLASATTGSGIGLPMARRIAELHGGRMWISGDMERGCDVRFTLCARPPSEDAASGGRAGTRTHDGGVAAA